MKRAQMIGLTSGINSVSNAWRSSSPGLSCCLCHGESPATASPPRSRAGVVGSTDTKISPSPRRTPPRCTHKAIPPMSSTQKKPENPGSTQISMSHLAVPAAAPTGRRRHWRARRRGTARRSTAAARRLRSSSPPAKHGGRTTPCGVGEWRERRPSAGGGDNGRRRSRSQWTRVKGLCFGEGRWCFCGLHPGNLRDVARTPPEFEF